MNELVGTTPDSVPRIDPRYRIESFLGSGSYAWVFLARHSTLENKQFAVKVLRPEHVEDRSKLSRFIREAELASALESPHSVDVIDYGETEEGAPYIVMEYVKGPDLGAVLDHFGVLDERIVARLVLDILSALDEAHGRGIVHRDLKPENVFIVEVHGAVHPIAKVGDFGIAKSISQNSPLSSRATQTAIGTVLCTPAYASPELLKGEVTVQADIYALGHMMAEMLDGEPPYRDHHPVQVGARQLEAAEVPLGSRSSRSKLRPVIELALAKDPRKRFSTAAEMRAALEEVAEAHGLLDVDTKPLDIASVRPRRDTGSYQAASLSQATRTDSHVFGDDEDYRTTDELTLKRSDSTLTDGDLAQGDLERDRALWTWGSILLVSLISAGIFLWFARPTPTETETETTEQTQAEVVVDEPLPVIQQAEPTPEVPTVEVTWRATEDTGGVEQQHGFAPPPVQEAVEGARGEMSRGLKRARATAWAAAPIVPWIDYVVRDANKRNVPSPEQ
jgi:serine/threonine-protein kinase